MKILKLRFKNLNSLYGEWSIDFTAPEYESSGIFAIIGPTGSGKSTVLDAICLALYARTPRLKSINNSGNEIMSRQTGECFAEVTFETGAGRFTCHWSQNRARKKIAGNLLPSKHEISLFDDGTPLATKKREVAELVEEKTGMDFERFTRSMLLAQGGFAAFLQAAPDERAPILEQITGTEIYTAISMKAHERRRAEHEKLDLLEAEMAGVSILSEDDEVSLDKELVVERAGAAKVGESLKKISDSISWLKNLAVMELTDSKLKEEFEKSKGELEAFSPNRQRLALALRSLEVEPEFVALEAKRADQKRDLEELAAIEKNLPEAEKIHAKAKATLELTTKEGNTAQLERAQGLEIVKQVRTLDAEIVAKRSELRIAENELKKATEQIASKEKRKRELRKRLESTARQTAQADLYLTEHASDEALGTELAGIVEILRSVESANIAGVASTVKANNAAAKLAEYEKRLAKECGLLEKVRKSRGLALERVKSLTEKIEEALDGKLLREYQTKKETLIREFSFIGKIESLEDERASLEDGAPCPLCGSEHHPYALGNHPESSAVAKDLDVLSKFILDIEKLEGEKVKANMLERSASNELSSAEKQFISFEKDAKAAADDLIRLEKEAEGKFAEIAALKASVLKRLSRFGVDSISENIELLLKSLEGREVEWRKRIDLKAETAHKSVALEVERKELAANLAESRAAALSRSQNAGGIQTELEKLEKRRFELFADKKADDEETRLEKLVSDADLSAKLADKTLDDARDTLNSFKTRVDALKRKISARGHELAELTESFLSACVSADFADENAFLSARLQRSEREKLAEVARALDDKSAEIATMRKDLKVRLDVERKRALTDVPVQTLEGERIECESKHKDLTERVGALNERRLANEAAKKSLAIREGELRKQKKECVKWDNLHALIGSGDGKKFRNFAQGLTFEVMVSHANKQLAEMTDRYLLIRDAREPLELNVIDSYQAGEIRSTKNLSGGEGFIVSLSLALGLSNMASRKVRIDSLFLDEGFGTLDEDALETALEALGGLRQSGKLIGIISHVPALRERITTLLELTPVSGGKSSIAGPGVVKGE